jgi:hypothetical protein
VTDRQTASPASSIVMDVGALEKAVPEIAGHDAGAVVESMVVDTVPVPVNDTRTLYVPPVGSAQVDHCSPLMPHTPSSAAVSTETPSDPVPDTVTDRNRRGKADAATNVYVAEPAAANSHRTTSPSDSAPLQAFVVRSPRVVATFEGDVGAGDDEGVPDGEAGDGATGALVPSLVVVVAEGSGTGELELGVGALVDSDGAGSALAPSESVDCVGAGIDGVSSAYAGPAASSNAATLTPTITMRRARPDAPMAFPRLPRLGAPLAPPG